MPDSITQTYFVPYRLAFTGPIPTETSLSTAMKLSSKVDFPPNLGPLSEEAAAAITTISSHLAQTGDVVVKRCDCSSFANKAPSSSSLWSLQRVFTSQRVVGWSAIFGGGYIMYTTLREGWKRKKEMEAWGIREYEEADGAGRNWWMVLGGGMYVVGVLVLGIRFEES